MAMVFACPCALVLWCARECVCCVFARMCVRVEEEAAHPRCLGLQCLRLTSHSSGCWMALLEGWGGWHLAPQAWLGSFVQACPSPPTATGGCYAVVGAHARRAPPLSLFPMRLQACCRAWAGKGKGKDWRVLFHMLCVDGGQGRGHPRPGSDHGCVFRSQDILLQRVVCVHTH